MESGGVPLSFGGERTSGIAMIGTAGAYWIKVEHESKEKVFVE